MSNLYLLYQAPPLILQLAIDGVLIGSLFALAAYGLALVWGVLRIINICQGEFLLLGGYVTYFSAQYGLPLALGFPLSGIVMFGVGYLLYRLVIFRLIERDLFVSLLATFGLSLLLAQSMNELLGADVRAMQTGLGVWFMFDGLVTVSQIKVVALFLTLAVAAILIWFMRRSRLGRAIRATAQNQRAARILGVNTDAVFAVTYALNAAICGLAGALVAMIWVIQPFAGLIYTLRAFMVVVVAGLGNLPGVIVAALGLGVIEQFVGFILGAQAQIAFVFCFLVVILVYRNLRLARQRRYLR